MPREFAQSMMGCAGCGRVLATREARINEDERVVVYTIGCESCGWRGEMFVAELVDMYTETRSDA